MDIVDKGDTILTTVETRIWPGRGFNSRGILLSRVRGRMRHGLGRIGGGRDVGIKFK